MPRPEVYSMKSLKFALAVAVTVLSAVPALAQDRAFDITAFAVWVDPNSEGTFDSQTPNQPLNVEFDGDLGYGLSANIFWGNRISTEFGISRVEPEPRFRTRAVNITGPDSIEMMPITAVVQFHLAPNGVIDPYIGAGAAYVLFNDVDSIGDLDDAGVSRIDFEDDAGLVVNAGLSLRFSPRLALNVDGKYVPVSSSATATYVTGPASETDIDINPVMFSAGLQFRF
jgi:outer membrane protein W